LEEDSKQTAMDAKVNIVLVESLHSGHVWRTLDNLRVSRASTSTSSTHLQARTILYLGSAKL
jgi:hypothetical protein